MRLSFPSTAISGCHAPVAAALMFGLCIHVNAMLCRTAALICPSPAHTTAALPTPTALTATCGVSANFPAGETLTVFCQPAADAAGAAAASATTAHATVPSAARPRLGRLETSDRSAACAA